MVGLPGRGGLPNHHGLHPRFDPHHRPVAEQFMTAWVRVLRYSSEATWNEATGQSSYPEPSLVWAGWARVQRMTQMEITRSIGDQQVVIRAATVSIPADTPQVAISDAVVVDRYRDPNTGDPHLLGRQMWVHDNRPGSMLWQRDLVALDAPITSR